MSKIELHMKANGLTQSALAEKLGIKPQTVSLWFRGLSEPHPKQYPVIAELLGLPAMEVVEFFHQNRIAVA